MFAAIEVSLAYPGRMYFKLRNASVQYASLVKNITETNKSPRVM